MTRGVHIGPFRRWHLSRLLEIEQASFAAEAWPREYFLELRHECPNLFLVAKLERRIAGYMVTCVEGRNAEIASLAVHPDYRRRGVADALMRYTLRRLPARGVRRAELIVRTGNTAGAQLYRSFGFRKVCMLRRYYEDGGDGFLMVRSVQ